MTGIFKMSMLGAVLTARLPLEDSENDTCSERELDDILQTDLEYWRHEPANVFVNYRGKLSTFNQWFVGKDHFVWLPGAGVPAVLKDDHIAWLDFEHPLKDDNSFKDINSIKDKLLRRAVHCELKSCKYDKSAGYHTCIARNANYVAMNGSVLKGSMDCPAVLYVKDLCPFIAPQEPASHLTKPYCETTIPSNLSCYVGGFSCKTYDAQCKGFSCVCPQGTCYVQEKCERIPDAILDSFQQNSSHGVWVCLNAEHAPSCARTDIHGWISKNRLRVVWNNGGKFVECEYLIYNCQINKLCGVAWDTSVECSWIRADNNVDSLAPGTLDACPSIALGDLKPSNDRNLCGQKLNSEHVFISFGLSKGYFMAQGVKSWGAGGPMRTDYDTCSSQFCDFRCVQDIRTCPLRCCRNLRFLRKYGHTRSENPNMTFADVCTHLGYAIDPIEALEELAAIEESKLAGIGLVALKMTSMPPFNMIQSLQVDPVTWLLFGLCSAIGDWLVSHSSQLAYHAFIESFEIYSSIALASFGGQGIGISASEFTHHAPRVLCKLGIGFMFIFVPSLIRNLAALFGGQMINGVFGIDSEAAQKGAIGPLYSTLKEWGGNFLHNVLDNSPIGDALLKILGGELLAPLFGPLLWQLHHNVVDQPAQFLHGKYLSGWFVRAMARSGVCDTSVHFDSGVVQARMGQLLQGLMSSVTDSLASGPEIELESECVLGSESVKEAQPSDAARASIDKTRMMFERTF
eukprot:TRINITY_DN16625_c0_g3_i2.p1 TRINITY_DN16625_c0_g3~~TRINITY_DN16625_c0_g3_i2.p1  ORF type:complete len:742 (+),score=43.26 TRINITY_DN16625_c0_g3_i2:140-2365(+)